MSEGGPGPTPQRCANGHPAPPDAVACPSCGAPLAPAYPGWGSPPPSPGPPPWYQPGPSPAPWTQPGAGGYWSTGYPPPQTTNGLAIASLVLGILWLWWIGSILAVIFGHIALGQIRARNQSGRGLAIAGLILGWVGVASVVVVIIALAIAAGSTGTGTGTVPLLTGVHHLALP
ncbi:MAG: DUF4190 domain-containing protein [Acidimicrobiales bacterium]